jgi:hypothetical protein
MTPPGMDLSALRSLASDGAAELHSALEASPSAQTSSAEQEGRYSKRISVHFAGASLSSSEDSSAVMTCVPELPEDEVGLYQQVEELCDACQMGPGAAEAWMARFQDPFQAMGLLAAVESVHAAAVAGVPLVLALSPGSPCHGEVTAMCTSAYALLACALAGQAWNALIVWEQGPVRGQSGPARALVSSIRTACALSIWAAAGWLHRGNRSSSDTCCATLLLLWLVVELYSVSAELQNIHGSNARTAQLWSLAIKGCLPGLHIASVGAQALLVYQLAASVRSAALHSACDATILMRCS